jgi:hypothetical protein
MRILIIAMGRSGGHSLLTWIGNEKKYQTIHEPTLNDKNMSSFNKTRLLKKNKSDVVVKYIINEIENELDTFDWDSWDKIIGLIRNDTMDCAISQYYSISTNVWELPYTLTDDWLIENEKNIKKEEIWIRRNKELICSIPQIELLVSYENLYQNNTDIEKLTEYLEIEKINSYYRLDNRYRLRKIKDDNPKPNLI